MDKKEDKDEILLMSPQDMEKEEEDIKEDEKDKENDKKEEEKTKSEKEFNNENEQEEIKIERLKGDNKIYDRSVKVILIGDSGVGKTNILNRLVNNKFNDKYNPSLSLEYNNHSIKINNYIIRMQIWDTAGQEKYNSIISNYYRSAEVAIFVYSIN